MLKSSNLNSVFNELATSESENAAAVSIRPATLNLLPELNNGNETPNAQHNNNNIRQSLDNVERDSTGENNLEADANSLSVLQLSAGLLQIVEPPIVRARGQLKELIGKQNKIYIDLSKEKYKLDCTEVAKLHEMFNDVKVYKEKLIKIKKQMQTIYQRTKVLKKRAANIQTCKQKEFQRKLEKQQQEESLIGRQTS